MFIPDFEKFKKSLKIPKGSSEAVKSKIDWQYNRQKKRDKNTNDDLQNNELI